MLGSIYRRSSGIYAVRIVVPQRHRSAIGRTEIHTSTGLRELNAAKLAALRIQIAWRTHFMELDRSKIETANPLILTNGLINLLDAATVLGLPLSVLLSELLNDCASIFVQATGWQGWWIPDLFEIERDYDDSFVVNDIETKGTRQSLTGIVKLHDTGSIIAGLNTGTASSALFRLDGPAAFFADHPILINSSTCFIKKAAAEQIRSRLAILLPPAPEKPLPSPSPTLGEAAPMMLDPVTAKHGKKRFSELFELYRSDREWGEEQRRRMTTEAGIFTELMDDPELGSIDKETVIEYAKRLSMLPSNIYLSKRQFKVNSLRELIEIADMHNLDRKGESTVKRHVGLLSEILNYGVHGSRMLTFNPAANFKRGKNLKKRASAQGDRDMFDIDDLARIFSADWFTTGSGKFRSHGHTNWRPHHYWLPLMGLLAGGRINELSQLYLDDIVQSETGVWYFDFNLNQPDKSDSDASEQDKSLKTINSIRVVPMHDTLVRLGLPDYVTSLREAGHLRLFPELTRDKVKGYGKPAGSWFNERFLGNKLKIERNGKKVFHSFRHTFATALERLDVPERVRAQLAGHQRGKTENGTRYTKDRTAHELHELVNRLLFACLDNIAPFCIPAGLRALAVADRLKKANARRRPITGEPKDTTVQV